VKKTIKTFCSSFLFIISLSASGVETFKHPTCQVHLHPFDKTHKKDDKLLEKLSKKLEVKGYNLKSLKETKKLGPGEFHVVLKKTLLGKGFKECLIEIIIKQARTNRALTNDPVFYKMNKSRKFPRQTFSGSERCLLALEDTFFALNICKEN